MPTYIYIYCFCYISTACCNCRWPKPQPGTSWPGLIQENCYNVAN